METLRQRFEWTYPHARATVEPGKTTVTALRKRTRFEQDDVVEESVPGKSSFNPVRLRTKMNAADVGVAHHLFLQSVELHMTSNEAELRHEAQRLCEMGILDNEQFLALDFGALSFFWQSEIGLKIRSHADSVHRELPFTARMDLKDLVDLGLGCVEDSLSKEFVVVQGIADLVVLLPDALWIVDFKTDHVRKEDWNDKVREYTSQLKLYSLALSRIYHRENVSHWLCFLHARRTIIGHLD